MTVPEDKVMRRVRQYLWEQYGKDNVTEEPTLDETGREPDFVVDFGKEKKMIEVENTAEDVISGGMQQARLYAAHFENAHAVVIYPREENVDEKELELLNNSISIIEI